MDSSLEAKGSHHFLTSPKLSVQSWENTSAGLTLKRLAQARAIKPPPLRDSIAGQQHQIGTRVEVKLSLDIVNSINNKVKEERRFIDVLYEKGPLGLAVVKHEKLIGKLKVTKSTGQSSEQGLMVDDIVELFNGEEYIGGASQFKKLLMGTPRPFKLRVVRQPDTVLYDTNTWYSGVVTEVDKPYGSHRVKLSCTGKVVNILDPVNVRLVSDETTINDYESSQKTSGPSMKDKNKKITSSIGKDFSSNNKSPFQQKDESKSYNGVASKAIVVDGSSTAKGQDIHLKSNEKSIETDDDCSSIGSSNSNNSFNKNGSQSIEKRPKSPERKVTSSHPLMKNPKGHTTTTLARRRGSQVIQTDKDRQTNASDGTLSIIESVKLKKEKERQRLLKLAEENRIVDEKTAVEKVPKMKEEDRGAKTVLSLDISERIKSESDLCAANKSPQAALDKSMVNMMKRSLSHSDSAFKRKTEKKEDAAVPSFAKNIDKEKLKEAIYRKLQPDKFKDATETKPLEKEDINSDVVQKEIEDKNRGNETELKVDGAFLSTPCKEDSSSATFIQLEKLEKAKDDDEGFDAASSPNSSFMTPSGQLSTSIFSSSHSSSRSNGSGSKKTSPLWEKIKNIVENKKYMQDSGVNTTNKVPGIIRAIDKDYEDEEDYEDIIEEKEVSEEDCCQDIEREVNKFEIGDKVIAAYAGGVEGWFSGVIDNFYDDGTYAVQYDMGEWEGHVPKDHIKYTENGSSKELPKTTSPVKRKETNKRVKKEKPLPHGEKVKLNQEQSVKSQILESLLTSDEGDKQPHDINLHDFLDFFEEDEKKQKELLSKSQKLLLVNDVGVDSKEEEEDSELHQQLSLFDLDDNEDMIIEPPPLHDRIAKEWLSTVGFARTIDIQALSRGSSRQFCDVGTPMHRAAFEGELSMLAWLFEQGAHDLDLKNADGFAPIHWASRNGHLTCCKWLVQKGANPSLAGHKGWRPYHLAAENGHTDIVKWLNRMVASNDIFEVDRFGWTPLHCAAHGGHLDCLALLHVIMDIKQKECEERKVRQVFYDAHEEEDYIMPTRVKDETSGSTTLHIASIAGHVEVCKWLMKDDEKRKKSIKDKRKALKQNQKETSDGSHSLSRRRYDQDVDVEYKYLPSVKNNHHETAVVLAAENGHLETLKALVQFVDRDQSNEVYYSNFSFDGEAKNDDHIYELRRRNQFGFPPFYYACCRGQSIVCKWLIINGGVNFDENQMLPESQEMMANTSVDDVVDAKDHVDAKLMLRMTLSDRSNILRSGGSRFINTETKKVLVRWARQCVDENYVFLSTLLFGITYVDPSYYASTKVTTPIEVLQVKERVSATHRDGKGGKDSGISGFKGDSDEEARRRILTGQALLSMSRKPTSMSELRLRRLQALEKKTEETEEIEEVQEVVPTAQQVVEVVDVTSEPTTPYKRKGGGCQLNGLPLLQGYEDSVIRNIADFLGIYRGRDLRLIREFAEAKTSSL